MIRNVKINDAKAICDIYNHYVKNTIVTFDIEPLTTQNFQEKIREITADFSKVKL